MLNSEGQSQSGDTRDEATTPTAHAFETRDSTADMLTVREAARRLNVSVGLIYALCGRGALDHHRYGVRRGTIRIQNDAIVAYQRRARSAGVALERGTTTGRGAFRQLDSFRLAQAWRKRGVL